MPSYDDIIALVRAGYSRAEIDAMTRTTPEPTPEPAPEPAPEPEPEPAPEPKSESTDNSAVLEAIKALTLAVQASNRANITIDTPTETAEAALASGVFGGKK